MVCVGYLGWLVHYAKVRPLDGDEGYYVTAASLVWEGKAPYRDFAYPQAPLLPYIYSWIWAVRPSSLVTMRLLSAACGGIAVFLWGVGLLSVERLPLKVALATFAVILLNPYWASWNVVVKTFAVANLLMTIAAIFVYIAMHSERIRWFFLAGLALGACASARGLYILMVPFVSLWLLHQDWKASKPPFPKTLTFVAGAACGLLPLIISFLGDPRAFIFNNVNYHPLIFSHETFRHTIHMYLAIFFSLLRMPYFVAEMALAIVGVVSLSKLQRTRDESYTAQDYLYFELAFLMFVVYLATALIPFPPFEQYFDSPLMPFLVPFIAQALRVIFQSGKKWVVVFALVVPILFFLEKDENAWQCSRPPMARISSFETITQAVKSNSNPDDVVLSPWSEYVFESGRKYFPGSEDKFNYSITGKMSPEARARYHVISKDEAMRAVFAGTVKVLVTCPWVFDEHDPDLLPGQLQAFHAAMDANYIFVGGIDGVWVYRRR